MTPTPALADPALRAALRRYRFECLRAMGAGAVLFAGAVEIINLAHGSPTGLANFVTLIGFVLGPVTFGMGAAALTLKSRRMRRTLEQEPAVERLAMYRVAANGMFGQPALVLVDDDDHPEVVCQVFAMVWRARRLKEGRGLPILVIGDPTRRAVVSDPDRRELLVVGKPRSPRIAKHLRRIAAAD